MGILDGKVAIITGGASGMGETHAKKFVDEGAKVVIGDVDVEGGEKIAAELGDDALFVELDVTSPSSWEYAVEQTKEKFNTIDILVNNAGVSGGFSGLLDIEEELYKKIIEVNQDGTFYGMRAVIPTMIENNGGSIVNISSLAGLRYDTTTNAAYSASKFAVRGFTKQAAYEFGDKNIRVNTILPGTILTPMAQEAMSPEEIKEVSKHIPMKRFSDPEETSEAVAFLASEKASYISGVDLPVDGGKASINLDIFKSE